MGLLKALCNAPVESTNLLLPKYSDSLAEKSCAREPRKRGRDATKPVPIFPAPSIIAKGVI